MNRKRLLTLASICALSLNVNLFAQKVEMRLNNVTVKEAMTELKNKSGYSFVYETGDINTHRVINVKANELNEVIKQIVAGQNVTYKIVGNNVVIKKAKSSKRTTGKSNSRKISGIVLDQNNNPVIGATILVKGSQVGTVTNIDGEFSMEANDDDVLSISYIGFENKDIKIGEKNNFNIKLDEKSEILDDVVVIGYGTQRKKDLTTSVATVSTKDLDTRPITSAADAIQGKAAGVQVVQPSGMPGSGISIRVRGATSIQASNEPLYVVDGITCDDISNISVNDIESMQVLKDASSAAIYGARAANGVVLITTKRGASDKTQVKLSAYIGISKLGKSIPALNTEEYKDLMKDLAKVSDAAPIIPENETRYTNWEDELFKTGVNQNYQLSLSNGSNKIRYFVSGGYSDEKGIVNKAYYKRLNLRANIDSDLFSWLTMSMSAAYTNSNGRSVRESRSSMRAGSILSVVNTPPFMQVWSPNNPGQYDEEAYGARILNPMAANEADMTTKSDRLTGALALTFNIYKGLTFKTNVLMNLVNSRDDYYLDPLSTSDGRGTKGYVSEGTSRNYEWTWENMANYTGQFGKSNITGLAGAIIQKAQYNGNQIAGFDLPDSYQDIHSVSIANQLDPDATWATAGAWSLASFLGRVNYAYDNKYLVTANVRADGSSRFSPGHRWGVFPSVSAGWRISSESFMEATRSVLDDLKIRGSWGLNGNQGGIGNYSYLAYMTSHRVPATQDNSYPGLAISPNTSGNTELTWEKTSQVNVGIDASLFGSRLIVGLDAYYKKTNDLLLTVYLPDNVNLPGGITRNDGSMANKGFEFNISSRNFTGEFNWTTDLNMSFNKNKVTKLGLNKVYYYASSYMTDEPAIVLREGLPLGSFFGYISEGVDPETGDIVYKDLNNNGNLDPGDRTVIGNAQPDFTYGMTNTFSYKGFDLSIFFQGSHGNDIFNASRIETEGMIDFRNQSKEVLRRWKRPGMETDIPRVGNMENIHNSTRFVEDGSYLRLKSLSLAYNFSGKWMKKAHLSKLQLYVTAQNLFTLTHYSGYCPEVNAYGSSSVSLGVDYGTYPQSKTFIFGTNIEF